ncbi:LPS translocon maturation chaperone LptM [Celerinatantimonas diazotrophica]|nr:lipoprotein [Celerinatantimonas diazotrophica]
MVTRIILIASLLIGLAGCGQKGPLYSPHPSAKSSVSQNTTTQPANE